MINTSSIVSLYYVFVKSFLKTPRYEHFKNYETTYSNFNLGVLIFEKNLSSYRHRTLLVVLAY